MAPGLRLLKAVGHYAPASGAWMAPRLRLDGALIAPASGGRLLCPCCRRLDGAWMAPGLRLLQVVSLAQRLEPPAPGAWKAPDPGAFQVTT